MHHIGFEQQWVTVQQKTFTKWSDSGRVLLTHTMLTALRRLNSKVNSRDVHVNDLVTDLSDGVIRCHQFQSPACPRAVLIPLLGHPYPPPGGPR